MATSSRCASLPLSSSSTRTRCATRNALSSLCQAAAVRCILTPDCTGLHMCAVLTGRQEAYLTRRERSPRRLRALYMICEAKGILHSYHQASRSFSRRIVKPSHSIPYYRLMEYGWQPSVTHTDFAGILNANALYSFTVGFPQLFFSIAFIVT